MSNDETTGEEPDHPGPAGTPTGARRDAVVVDGDVSGQIGVGDWVVQLQTTPDNDRTNAKTTILFWAANPVDTDALRLDEEVRTIDERLQTTELRDRFDLRQQWALRIGDLSEGLLRYRPSVVHFSGHGSAAGRLMVEDGHGASTQVPPAALAMLFATIMRSESSRGLVCVVFNACYSAAQAEAVAQHVPCVVGTSRAIGDDAAIRFAGGFYRALGYGESIQVAFELGRNEIALHGLDEETTPRLHTRSDVDAASVKVV